jgi:Uma2 family endonuclease
MAIEFADRPVHPITVEEALRMLDAGVFLDPSRIELLRGVLLEKPVKSPDHAGAKKRLGQWLKAFYPDQLRLEDPIVLPDGISMPEPDLAVVESGEYTTRHPTSALLVIEVSKTSHKLDTIVKPPLYASAGVPDYWVVDVVNQRVVVFREPEPDGYASQTIHEPPGSLQPIAVDVPPLDLAQFFR